ncbi:MAG: HAMP domain-containing histidine kinase [candidate division Zixibacteria bacterium]|nr:HAMP domain-containing histidine kinase [candidate division Zixibacteria bacterium]
MNSFNRRSLAVIFFTGLLIVIVNLTWWLFYAQTENSFEEQLSRRLTSLVSLGASGLDAETVSTLADGYLSGYEKALDKLEQIKTVDSLSEVFILDTEYNYLVTTSFDEDSIYYLVSLNRDAIDSIFFNRSDEYLPSVSASYQTDDFILKSAFAPLFDSTGEVRAVLGIEADVDYTDDLFSLRRSLYISTAVSVGFGLLFGILFFMVHRKIGLAERSIMLSQSQANLGRMVAVVSHEVKNPLMIMRASAESLKKESNKPEADFIIEEIDRLNQIVSGYLGFASGKLILKTKLIDINELVTEIITKFAPRLNNENILLKFESKNEIEDKKNNNVLADPIALRQVIINLILNASDALADSTNPEIKLDIKHYINKTHIYVSDNGPGIDKKIIKNIFEPFYTTKTTGSGLGLFHTRKLMEAMSGTIDVEVDDKKQTTFVLSLPSADKEK